MAVKIIGNTSGNIMEVDSGLNANVTLPQVTTPAGVSAPQYVGAARMFSENDPGTILGEAELKSPETSADYRLRVGMDSIWDTEDFNYVAQNFNKHKYTSNTLTMNWAAGALNTNATNATTTATGCQLQTYRHFPIIGAGSVYAETTASFSNTIGTDINIDFGLPLLAAASTSIPLDGIYFRASNGGVFGVLNNNGTEITTSAFAFTPVENTNYKFTISSSRNNVEFWIDDVLYGVLERQPAAGKPTYGSSLPWGVRHHHTGVAGSVVNFKVANYVVTLGDIDTNRLWPTVMAGQGQSGLNYPSGMAAGQTANNTNSAAPAAATLSNTAAGYTTLGGQFLFAAVAGAETDYALFAFLNPVPTTSITGRNLVVRGVWIDMWNQVVAVATTPTVFQWSLAVGSTAVSLATTDGAATRLPKRILLGCQSLVVGSVVGAPVERVDCNLDAPVICEPGTYLHIILKMPIGTATATETFRGNVGINAYWE